jgi:hypothetical protein
MEKMEKILLGDEIKDKITGFRGIAVARYSYLQGCDRICIQPKVDKAGRLPKAETFDEPLLLIIKKFSAKKEKGNRGGPMPYIPEPRSGGIKKGR